jgi:hypothetical protein
LANEGSIYTFRRDDTSSSAEGSLSGISVSLFIIRGWMLMHFCGCYRPKNRRTNRRSLVAGSPLPSSARCSLPSLACSRMFSDETAGRPGTSSRLLSGFSPMHLPPIRRTTYATRAPVRPPWPLRCTSIGASLVGPVLCVVYRSYTLEQVCTRITSALQTRRPALRPSRSRTMGMLWECALLSTGPVEEGPQRNAAPMPQTHVHIPGTSSR